MTKLVFTAETQRAQRRRRGRQRLAVLALCALCVCGGMPPTGFARHARPAPVAHKFYASLAQIEHNPESKSLEVSLRVFADDLELALTKRAGKTVSLDRTPNAADLVRAYLQERFEVRGRDGKAKTLKWVGMEAQVDSTWVYFEMPVPEGLGGTELRDGVLLELFPDQVNTATLKAGGVQRDFVFRAGDDGWKKLSAS